MYDTLMQMGRWFGYRPGVRRPVPPCLRLRSLVEWFEHITAANEELQLEFNHMAVTGGTPADYGLKVRSHPDLMVTSIVKMRSGTSLQISFAGVVSETVVFDRDREVNTSEHRQRQRPCSRGFVRPTNAEQFGSHPEPHGQLRVDRSQP